jgi:MscS family membrane protein
MRRSRWFPRFVAISWICLATLALPRLVRADPPRPAASAHAPIDIALEMAPDSPRASVKRYFDLCRAGEYADAADYLDLPRNERADGAELARKLKVVLDREIWVKLESISPQPLGNQSDKLPPGVEELGVIKMPSGEEPIRLVRRTTGEGGPRWVFSRTTMEHVEGWYNHLGGRWQLEYLPERLLRPGFRELLWWQWIALPSVLALALALGKAFGFAAKPLEQRIKNRRPRLGAALGRLGTPINFGWALIVLEVLEPYANLVPPAAAFVDRVLAAGLLSAFFWLLFAGIDLLGDRLLELESTKQNPAARSLVPLLEKAFKVAVFAIALIAALSELGYPVTSLVAGLGIGGVALALAAQKTVENLFGSVAIAVDQPFSVGDFVKIDDVIGTVESIGLRSTRVRTLDRTVVTIPNGKLADQRVESLSARDRVRLRFMIGLEVGTPSDVVRATIAGLEEALTALPRVIKDTISVKLIGLGAYSLDIEVLAGFDATADDLMNLRQDALLQALEVVEKAGGQLALPTQKLRLDGATIAAT